MGRFKWPILPSSIDSMKDLPITLFDIPFLMHLRANYLAFNIYLGKQYRLYTDCAII